MKFVVAASAHLAEPKQLIEGQRRRVLTVAARPKRAARGQWKSARGQLLVEGAILHLKADLDWLELIEQRLAPREEV